MCRLKSGVCLKDRVYIPDHDHHDRMLEELGIVDDFINACNAFAHFELSPAEEKKPNPEAACCEEE